MSDTSWPLPRPVVLIHGWGPPAIIGFGAYKRFLIDDGMPRKDIHLLKYHFTKDLDQINRELVAQLHQVFASYPVDQELDVIGHSTGEFVGLRALLTSGYYKRVHTFVGLSGIGHGWDCGLCEKGFLGKAIKTLSPAYNSYVMDFYTRYQSTINSMKTCTLFSPDDGLIAPYDSGRIDGGINVEVPGMRHMDAVKKWTFYREMLDICYHGS